MPEYIEREALQRCHFIQDEWGEWILAEDIINLPAADVRPVVTCADCKFWDRERISCEGLARCNTGESGIRYRNRNDFCSHGERECET